MFFLFGCTKHLPEDQCIEEFISTHDLIRYDNRKADIIEGQFFYTLYEYDEGYFILKGHHVIDFAPIPLSCSGEWLCEDVDSKEFQDIFSSSENIGIFAISKE